MQRGAVGAVGKAVLQYQVLPLLQQCGGGVPVQREHEDHHVVLDQAALLALDIDTEVRVLAVQVDHGDALDPSRCLQQAAVDLRSVQ